MYRGSKGGVLFKLNTAGQYTVLYTFTSGTDGVWPLVGVVLDPAGNLYGTTQYGGYSSACYGSGCGVVYKLDTAGQYTVLYSFSGENDGGDYASGLIPDPAGNLYGTTTYGGTHDGGMVFKIKQ